MVDSCIELKAGDITAVVGDNSSDGDHKAGYNGLWSLTSTHQPDNLFVPLFAGMNLEHVMDGHDLHADERVFEPRKAPMEMRKLSDTAAELHQPPTPVTGIESWTTFTLAPPHAIDFAFRIRATRDVFPHGYVGFFWASYIRAPADKTIHFRGKVREGAVPRMWQEWEEERWMEYHPAFQCDNSSVCREGDDPVLSHDPESRPLLYTSYSHLCYTLPFYYGISNGMCFQYMFDRDEGIRFTNGVTGAGEYNPAWDYQWFVPGVEVGKEYGFKARAIYKPFVSRADCLQEYETWSAA